MNVKPFRLLLFIFIVLVVIGIYYSKLLSVGPNENKKIALLKQIFSVLIIIGFINLYNVSENRNIKMFWLVVIACIVNGYSVIHSTSKCRTTSGDLFPKLYRFELVLFSLIITITMSGIIWYSTDNDIFGFLSDDDGDPPTKAKKKKIIYV